MCKLCAKYIFVLQHAANGREFGITSRAHSTMRLPWQDPAFKKMVRSSVAALAGSVAAAAVFFVVEWVSPWEQREIVGGKYRNELLIKSFGMVRG